MFNYCLGNALGLIAALAAALWLPPWSPAFAATAAGSVELVEGEVQVLRENQALAPKVGDAVNEGDTVVTGKDGELHLRMEDHGFLAVRPNTRMKIEAYRAEGDADDRSILSLFTGTLRSITGWIGKNVPRNYSIRTPTAALGIRGTDHEPLYIPEEAAGADGAPGTYDKVNEGETFIQNRRGKVFVKSNQAAFVAFHGRAAPKLLKTIPAFFRPTRNETQIEKRREALKKEIEKRLEERRDGLKNRQEERKRKLEQQRLQREDEKRDLQQQPQEREARKDTLEERRRQREAGRGEHRERQKTQEEKSRARDTARSEHQGKRERREAAQEKRRDRDHDREERGRRRREQ